MRSDGARPQSGRADAEAEHGHDKHPHGPEPLREPAGQRHRDRLRHRIGGDHPGALAGRTARPPAILGTDTLAMVMSSTTMKLRQRQEAAGDPQRRAAHGPGAASSVGLGPVGHGALLRPGLSVRNVDVGVHRKTRRAGGGPQLRGSRATRTGRRWTTLIQLPVAFWAGIRAKAAPVPPAKPTTCRETSRRRRRCRSQGHRLADAHLAQLHLLEVGVDIGLSTGTTLIRSAPTWTRWPTATCFLATTPSNGAARTVRSRLSWAWSRWRARRRPRGCRRSWRRRSARC